jgi:hypothetical protein
MVNLFLNLNEEFLLVFDLVLLKILHFLLHFRDWIAARSQDEAPFFLLLGRLDVSWNRIAKHFMVYFALSTLRLPVKVLVQLQRTEAHIVPKLRILPQDTQRDLFETFEGFIVLVALKKRQSVVEYDLMALLRGRSTQVLIWVNFSILLYIWIVEILVIRFIKELDRFRKVINGHVVFLEFHVHYAHVIEVVLGMSLVALLVNKIVSGDFVLSSQCLAVLMGLERFATRDGIFFVYPKSLDAFMDSIALDERPCFQMREHTEMLSDSWKIDFFFE